MLMAPPDLPISPELRRAILAELTELKSELGVQKAVAEALGVSESTISNALNKIRASRDLLQSVLKYRELTEAMLLEKHAVAAEQGDNGEPWAADAKGYRAADEISTLAIAAANFRWEEQLSLEQRTKVMQAAAERIERWGRAQRWGIVRPSVDVWLDALVASQAELILAAFPRRRTRRNEAVE